MSENVNSTIKEDLLEGADQIAEFLFGDAGKRRKIYHLAEVSNLPVFKPGGVLLARKSTILKWIEEQEKAASFPKIAD
jgi:hypothetical protein